MQLGTENRNKTMVAIGLMVVALVFVVVRFIPDSPAAAKSPAPVVTPPPGTRRIVTVRTAPGKKPGPSPEARSLDPTLRYDWLKASEDTKYSGRGAKHLPGRSRDSETDRAGACSRRTGGSAGPAPAAAHQSQIFWFCQQAGRAQEDFSLARRRCLHCRRRRYCRSPLQDSAHHAGLGGSGRCVEQ